MHRSAWSDHREAGVIDGRRQAYTPVLTRPWVRGVRPCAGTPEGHLPWMFAMELPWDRHAHSQGVLAVNGVVSAACPPPTEVSPHSWLSSWSPSPNECAAKLHVRLRLGLVDSARHQVDRELRLRLFAMRVQMGTTHCRPRRGSGHGQEMKGWVSQGWQPESGEDSPALPGRGTQVPTRTSSMSGASARRSRARSMAHSITQSTSPSGSTMRWRAA